MIFPIKISQLKYSSLFISRLGVTTDFFQEPIKIGTFGRKIEEDRTRKSHQNVERAMNVDVNSCEQSRTAEEIRTSLSNTLRHLNACRISRFNLVLRIFSPT